MKIIALFCFLLCLASSAAAQAGCSNCPKNSQVFTSSASQWQIPNSATSLTIEAWGGGGGGSLLSGGQGGGYFKTVIPVAATPPNIDVINVTIGNGGPGCAPNKINGTSGGNTTITYSVNPALGLVTLTAFGGSGSNPLSSNLNTGSFSTSAPAKFYFVGETGQLGTTSRTVSTMLVSAGAPATSTTGVVFPSFYVSAVGGDGGPSGHSTHTSGAGGSEFVLAKVGSFSNGFSTALGGSLSGVSGVNGTVPGGGGGGAPNISGQVACGSGANGLVIFTW